MLQRRHGISTFGSGTGRHPQSAEPQSQHDWDWVTLRDEPFTDDHWADDYIRRHGDDQRYRSLNDLLMFTDGSVEERRGGYGAYLVPESIYYQLYQLRIKDKRELLRIADEQCQEDKDDALFSFLHTMIDEPLSERCSIDFCESHAIHDQLRRLYCKLEEQTIQWRTQNMDKTKACPFANEHGIHRILIVFLTDDFPLLES